jgi:Elongation factor G, domain IV
VVGFIEPLPAKEDGSPATGVEFENHIVGSAIPSNFIPSVEKGFREAATTGAVIGYPMEVSISECSRGVGAIQCHKWPKGVDAVQACACVRTPAALKQ